MKKWVNIILIIFGVFFLLFLVILIITIYQASQIMKFANDPLLNQDFKSFMKGDCSKLNQIESKLLEINSALGSACWNPIIRAQIKSKSGRDICIEAKDPNSDFNKAITHIKNYCLNNSNN